MIIKSLSGKTLIQTDHKTMRGALEYCAENDIRLEGADLRRAKLNHANLDGLCVSRACLWGADFTSSDIGFADLSGTDLRGANFKDACLAETDLAKADMRGAYFSHTIIEGACFDQVVVSCPTFWDCDLKGAASLKGLTFSHKGEDNIVLSSPPLIIHGLQRRIVLLENCCLWGNDLYPAGLLPRDAQKELFILKTAADQLMKGNFLPIAMKPIPKINKRPRAF